MDEDCAGSLPLYSFGTDPADQAVRNNNNNNNNNKVSIHQKIKIHIFC